MPIVIAPLMVAINFSERSFLPACARRPARNPAPKASHGARRKASSAGSRASASFPWNP